MHTNRETRRHGRAIVLGPLLCFTIFMSTACSKDSSYGPWKHLPKGAEEVSDEQLEELRAGGDLEEITPERRATQEEARKQQLAEDTATMEQLFKVRPELRTRLTAKPGANVHVLPSGNYERKLANGKTITLMGQAAIYHQVAASYRRFNSLANQQLIFKTFVPRLPAECTKDLPAPTAIDKLSVEQLKVMNRKAAACWRTKSVELSGADPAEPAGRITDPTKFTGQSNATDSATGDTSDDGCGHWKNGIYQKVNWLGKSFDSNVKNQGRRGACTSFAVIGAMENDIARLYSLWVNLSEQSLYAKAKLHWAPDDLEDGLNLVDTVDSMVSSKWSAPFEQVWPYNPSFDRMQCEEDTYDDYDACVAHDPDDDYDLDYYTDSCDDYTGPACSDTTHQGKLVCNNSGCYYWTPRKASDGAYGIDGYVELDDIEDDESATLAMFALSVGYSLAVGFDTYESFHAVGNNGIYQGTKDSDEHSGGHAVQVSGILFNQNLPSGITHGQGGGYIVLKNSWGTCSGDGGYYFMSFAAADEVMHAAVALVPSQPLLNSAPTIAITAPQNGASSPFDPLGTIHLAATVSDFEDGAGCCAVKWTSPQEDTVLGTGKSVDAQFQNSGYHDITATVTDSEGKQASATIHITLNEQLPEPEITFPLSTSKIYKGVIYVLKGHATDPNSLGTELPCSNLTWSSNESSDGLNGKTGCSVEVTFTTAGTRHIYLSASRGGSSGSASASVNINVLDPPVTDPPVATILSPIGTKTVNYSVNPGATVNFSASATSPGGFGSCRVGATDCLSYSWRLKTGSTWDTLGTTKQVSWVTTDNFHCVCSTISGIEVQFCATDPNGTSCDSTFLSIKCPAC